METLPDDLRLIGPEELAALLGRSAKAIKVEASQRPEALPPRFRVSMQRRSLMRWRLIDVRAWMDQISREGRERAEAEKAARAKGRSWHPWS